MRNPITIEAFAEWCERQPPHAGYYYGDVKGCAFCQYLKSIGISSPIVGGAGWTPSCGSPSRSFPTHLARALAVTPYTYGALASRLRNAIGGAS